MSLGIIARITELVLNYMVHFSYAAVFFVIILGSVGIPIPEELVLLIAGYLSSIGVMNIFGVIGIAIIATTIADNISYWIGRKKGVHILRSSLAVRIFLSPRRLAKIERHFARHGGKIVLFARFMLGFRMISYIIAGSSKMPWRTFQKYNIIGVAIWVPFVTLVGYVLSSGFLAAWRYAEKAQYVILALIIVVVVGYLFLRKFRRKVEGEDDGSEPYSSELK